MFCKRAYYSDNRSTDMGRDGTVGSQRCQVSLQILCKTLNIVKIGVSLALLNCKCYLNLFFLFSLATIFFSPPLLFWGSQYKCDILGNKQPDDVSGCRNLLKCLTAFPWVFVCPSSIWCPVHSFVTQSAQWDLSFFPSLWNTELLLDKE